MAFPETAKDAHRGNGDVLLNSEQFCRPLDLIDSKIAERLQVTKLIRKFAISTATAAVVAELAFVAGESR
jgi:hypothetical protein